MKEIIFDSSDEKIKDIYDNIKADEESKNKSYKEDSEYLKAILKYLTENKAYIECETISDKEIVQSIYKILDSRIKLYEDEIEYDKLIVLNCIYKYCKLYIKQYEHVFGDKIKIKNFNQKHFTSIIRSLESDIKFYNKLDKNIEIKLY